MPVHIRCQLRRTTISVPRVTILTQRVLEILNHASDELGVVIVGAARIRHLNKRYRHKDVPTDVLAFSLREAPGPATSLLGDVVIALPVAIRQAARYGHTADEEFVRLLVHGILHLLGYDHERSPQEAHRMQQLEHSIFTALMPIPRIIDRAAWTFKKTPSSFIGSRFRPSFRGIRAHRDGHE
ncbi:MAG: rRNA maturation RNase YbeY [Nitrospirae bacterium]|nr:MAG: rRNA maturation RNase YbeY [Nitrospirota bacterium]